MTEDIFIIISGPRKVIFDLQTGAGRWWVYLKYFVARDGGCKIMSKML